GRPRMLVRRSLKTIGWFAGMRVLWSLWMSPSLGDWLSLFVVDRMVSARLLDGLPVVLVGTVVTAGVSALPGSRFLGSLTAPAGVRSFPRHVVVSALCIAGVLVVSQPAVT